MGKSSLLLIGLSARVSGLGLGSIHGSSDWGLPSSCSVGMPMEWSVMLGDLASAMTARKRIKNRRHLAILRNRVGGGFGLQVGTIDEATEEEP